ncbi:MAG: molybdate ABC transporter substrate-binding protein [Phaeodactylibacter sp.]|nr:molybdate ABC transporter substrate-binding protein [Phaeodactylibacter sp.]MCB9304350.1 molybdate ABC transporter substrate-binding protein [Lewinellaceae bacterium]HQU57583.1 molybdate ABC transporter substrate-binding protein [Saprospiraceae bacterium]
MKKSIALFLGFAIILAGCQPSERQSRRSETITVAVAANVQFAMEELESAFEAESGIAVETTISSSGKLTAQIQQGAPYDLLVSADMKYPTALVESGKAVLPVRAYGFGALVLWTQNELELEENPAFLLQDKIRKIAIANPRNAPYGEQAMHYFEHYGIAEQVASKLVYGESIAQTNQYILSHAADLGLTAKSVVLSPEMKGTGKWLEIPAQSYEPIAQGVVITSYGQKVHPEASRRFFEFLFSPKARVILEKYGYELPKVTIG